MKTAHLAKTDHEDPSINPTSEKECCQLRVLPRHSDADTVPFGPEHRVGPKPPFKKQIEVSKRLLGWLFRTLSKELRDIGAEFISEAIMRAVREYRRRPNRFMAKPGLPLDYYLLHASARNLSNLVRSERGGGVAKVKAR